MTTRHRTTTIQPKEILFALEEEILRIRGRKRERKRETSKLRLRSSWMRLKGGLEGRSAYKQCNTNARAIGVPSNRSASGGESRSSR